MRSASIKATAMMMSMVCTKNETNRVPRRREPTLRIAIEKIIEPKKNDAIETRDFSQPHGLLFGWFEAPRPRKMVFPVLEEGLLVFCVSRGKVVGCFGFAPPPLCGRATAMTRTCLHSQEAGPRIVGATIA